jgi:hypothetical protein
MVRGPLGGYSLPICSVVTLPTPDTKCLPLSVAQRPVVQYVDGGESYEGQGAIAPDTDKCMVALSAEAVYPLRAEELPI